MTNKEFAEKNAGKYFRFEGRRVRVVGYDATVDYRVIITSIGRGWNTFYEEDCLIVKTKARGFWYVSMDELKEIEK